MWLYYIPTFAELLEKRYDSSGDEIDRSAEFPTRAAHLLYDLVRHVTTWTEIFRHLPAGAVHRTPPDRPEYPGTVPHAAAQALGSVLATVVMSNRIDEGVIQTLHDVTIQTIKAFHPDDGAVSQMRAYLIDCLLRGGHRRANRPYLAKLSALLANNDDFLEYEVKDYVDALRAKLEEGPPQRRKAKF